MASDETKRVVVNCPHCSARLRLPVDRAGTVDCPRCSIAGCLADGAHPLQAPLRAIHRCQGAR
jgi:uncharacterized paraquat-inducible protein A